MEAATLSFTEKRGLQKTVQTNLAALAAGGVSFTEKRRLQKEIADAMAKLGTAAVSSDTYLPPGWTESAPGGMATNTDPIAGGIVDKEIVSGEWFVIPENDTIDKKKLTGFKTRKAAFDAFAAALSAQTPATLDELNAVMPLLKQFIGKSQLSVVQSALKGEESQFFIDKMLELANVIKGMPETYQTDGQGDKAVAYLHYFKGGSDWYITEKDKGASDDAANGVDAQSQAFGYAILNGDKQNAESGYISIAELIKAGVELDFYWKPKSLGEIKGAAVNTSDDDLFTPENLLKELRKAVEDNGGEVLEADSFGQFVAFAIQRNKALLSYSEGNGFRVSYGENGLTFTDYFSSPWSAVNAFAATVTGDAVVNSVLKELLDGKYNSESPETFLAIVQKVIDATGDVAAVIPACIAYIDANQDKVSAIMESAMAEAFGAMWGKVRDAEQLIAESAGGRRTRAFPMGISPTAQRPATDPVRVVVPATDDLAPPRKVIIEIDESFNEPVQFRGIIQAIEAGREGDETILRVNSNGGDTQAAQAVYVALQQTPAKTKAVVINAYSSGSIVTMACDEIEPTPFCSMMIHNASTFSGGKLGDIAGGAAFKQSYFVEWFQQLYAGFLTDEELKDIAKGQDIWLKENDIRERLQNWVPIRKRSAAA